MNFAAQRSECSGGGGGGRISSMDSSFLSVLIKLTPVTRGRGTVPFCPLDLRWAGRGECEYARRAGKPINKIAGCVSVIRLLGGGRGRGL